MTKDSVPLMKYLTFTLLCALLLPTSSHAADWCQPTTSPSISVHTSTNDISYNFSQSMKQLDHFGVTTVNPYASNVITDVGGLMKGGIETQQRMSFGTMTNRSSGEICFWHDTIDVSINIRPIIYVASDFPRGTCKHNAILEHEYKHIVVDREIVNKYAKLIGQALKEDVTRYRIFGPVPISNQSSLQSQLKQRMQSILTQYTNQMSAERKARQQQIDSLSEYERVNHLCRQEK